jgi:enediyne biosynthesis protein E4
MKKIPYLIPVVVLLALLIGGCKKENNNALFRMLPAGETGITFNNVIHDNDSFNILSYEYIYNGGGVGVADFNNDGLQDVFFSGNLVPNKLYINKGELKFEDVSDVANISGNGRWCSGVSVVDINNDGWMDVYVTATMHADSSDRKNMMFINKGLNNEGIPVFEDQAAKYGIEVFKYSIASAFFDYDRDGDLDLYVLINQRLNNFPTNYRPKMTDGSSPNNDRLYKNNGDGTFTNVTNEAGVTFEGFGLGLAISDFNKDGWPDIYVSNDYLSNDLLYINQQNGTFRNEIATYIGHQSQFSMGNDAADFNNDTWSDIITLDMLPETNDRKKTTISNKSYQTYINNEQYKYEYQYVRNMLHLNNGLAQGVKFSEIGQLAGVYQTEWSWSPLMADIDNDGLKDILITNGFPKDITDKDFANYRADVGNFASIGHLNDSIPVIKIPNYAFRNNGDLTFSDVTRQWGLDTPSFSNGAAFVDFDNDGDLDYVINNINAEASVYENTLYTEAGKNDSVKNSFLRVALKGPSQNVQALGAKVTLYQSGKVQYQENYIYRGFLSSVEGVMHFGLGDAAQVDSVVVEWPGSKVSVVKNVKTGQLIRVDHKDSKAAIRTTSASTQSALVHEIAESLNIHFKHAEEDKIDFNLQRTLPHKFTQDGPGLAVGDINQDGREDFIVGGSANTIASIFTQQASGTFVQSQLVSAGTKTEEDEGLLLFDADGDTDLDLYIVSGSIEGSADTDYQDKLYLNNGKGKFDPAADAIPDTRASGSCVRAADYDADGDLDLFVGGRVIARGYPMPATSYILRNDKGKFADVTAEVASGLQQAGMITDALWTDFNNDNKIDLLVTGEFMPVTFFRNDGTKFTKAEATGIDKYTGWWNSITSGDYDRDGDIDYVAGNLGLNNNYQVTDKMPLKVFAKDFDGNGSVDPIMACYMRASMASETKNLYPVHFWDELNSQSPKFRNKYSRYRQYSKATIEQLLPAEDLKDAVVLEANHMQTSYIENKGNGKFEMRSLPMLAQVAPVKGLLTFDVNEDGNLDVLMIGNDYGNEVFTGRYDAFTGLILLGDGKGKLTPVPSAASGFYIPGDAKGLVHLSGKKGDMFIASQNRDSLRVFAPVKNTKANMFKPELQDVSAQLIYADGHQQKIEFYYGAGYLSQSTRVIRIPPGVKELKVYDGQGKSRTVLVTGS